MLGEKRQRRAGPEDDGEEMGELAGEAKEQMLAAHLLDMVGPKLRQPARGLSLEEAGGGSFQTGESLVGGEPVDVHGGGGDVVRSTPPAPYRNRSKRKRIDVGQTQSSASSTRTIREAILPGTRNDATRSA